MRTDASILDVLCCPRCAGALVPAATERAADGHVLEGTLTCRSCAAVYDIRRGVPRLAAGTVSATVARTVDGFGWQWQQANRILRDARFSGPAVFLDFVAPVRAEFFAGKTVLDAGCGLGRFTALAAEFGSRLVVGVDLSDAVDVAFENTRHLHNVVIVQGDIFALPVRVGGVDYAFSVGVLHHTADPRRAFLSVVSKIAAGGAVSAWVYGRERNGWIVYAINPVRRVTSRLPRPLLLAAAYAAAAPLAIVSKGVYGPVATRPSLGWLRQRLFYFDYLAFLAQFTYPTLAFIVFDHAVPTIAEYIRREEFADWFAAAGLREVVISSKGGNSWRGFARVPVSG